MQNQEYVKEIIEKHGDMVYRLAITRTGSKENAEDIFQEVFLKFSQKMPEFKNGEHEKAWFIRVTINLSKNLKNSAWNRRVAPLDENIEFMTEKQQEIIDIVNKLPKDYRTVIYLLYYEGYKVREIAKLMKKSEGTIKTWSFRARNILKSELEGGFENE